MKNRNYSSSLYKTIVLKFKIGHISDKRINFIVRGSHLCPLCVKALEKSDGAASGFLFVESKTSNLAMSINKTRKINTPDKVDTLLSVIHSNCSALGF